MYLRYFLDEQGKRQYTFKVSFNFISKRMFAFFSSMMPKVTQLSLPILVSTISLSDYDFLTSLFIIARFSKDDPYQKQRMKCKERFNLLLTQ